MHDRINNKYLFSISNFSIKIPIIWVRFGVLFVAGYLLLPKTLATLPLFSLDGSWAVSINLAILHKLHFGTDYIFTYGPLGFLTTRFLLGIPKFVFILFDLFTITNILLIFNDFVKNSDGRFDFLNYLLIITTSILLQGNHPVTLLYVITVYYLIKGYQNPSSASALIICSLCSAILFFIKVNYGIVTLIIYFIVVVIAVLRNKGKGIFPVYVSAILNISIIAILAQYFNVDLLNYIKSSMHIIGAYNDAMVHSFSYTTKYTVLYVLIMILYTWSIYFYFKEFKLNLLSYFTPVLIFFTLFISFKSGFVRADEIHIVDPYLILPLIAIIPASINVTKTINKYHRVLFYISLILCLSFVERGNSKSSGRKGVSSIIHTSYFHDIITPRDKFISYDNELKDIDKAATIKTITANKSIDIFPWQICYAYANNLNYNPRPICQSYSAYDYYLDTLNAIKISGHGNSAPPEYLLFSNTTIDYRIPFGDESITKRAILEYYSPIDTFTLKNFVEPNQNDLAILFKRRETPLKLIYNNEIYKKVKFNDWIDLDSTYDLQYLFSDVKYSAIGQLKRMLFRPSIVNIILKFEDGSETIHFVPVSILKTGILINKKVETTEDAYLFFKELGKENKKISSIKFVTDRQRQFENEITVIIKSCSTAVAK